MPLKSKNTATAKCCLCGKTYVVERYRLGRTKFCGFQCKQKGAAYKAGQKRIADARGSSKEYVKYYDRNEHRRVAELKIGRPLEKGEVVHHKDRNKKNNHPDNLVVTTQSEHIKHHWAEMMKMRKIKRGY